MSQPANEFEGTKTAPSTPPLFSISSPDLKNFKSWIRTSPFTNDFELSKDKFQLSDMDFEAAYAMFTAKTPPVHHNSALGSNGPAAGSAAPSLITNYQSELTNQLQELHSQRDSNHKITSPGLSHIFQHSTSPHFPPTELDNLGSFPNYDELLSVNESNAIEQFLDSIMDGQGSNSDGKKQHHEHGETHESHLHVHHQTQLQPPLHPLSHIQSHPTSMKPDHMSNYESSDFKNTGFIESEASEPQPIMPKVTATDTVITINNTKHINLPKDPSVFPEELNISNEVPSVPSRSNSATPSNSEPSSARKAKKRKLLTEEEKKFNHLSSEQKRRAIIKDAFDDLVKLLPIEISKKQPKSVVLETAASEIERIIKINNELEQLLNKSL